MRSLKAPGKRLAGLALILAITGGTGKLVAQAPVQTVSDQDLSQLFYQMQLLQQEVMELRGIVEEQQELVRQLKSQSLERYVDIDRRLGDLATQAAQGGVPVASAAASSSLSSSSVTSTASSRDARTAAAERPKTEAELEVDAYRKAYALVRARKFDEALPEFERFLQQYPDGKYTGNAWYWSGELYLLAAPPSLSDARNAFNKLITLYPSHRKVPDSLYKLGKVFFLQGENDKARNLLNRVIDEYGASNSSAPKLAKKFLKENF